MKEKIRELRAEEDAGRRRATQAEVAIRRIKEQPAIHHDMIALACFMEFVGHALRHYAYDTYAKRCVIRESVLEQAIVTALAKGHPDATVAFNFFGRYTIKLFENEKFLRMLENAQLVFPQLHFEFSTVVEDEFFNPETGHIVSPEDDQAVLRPVSYSCLEISLK